MEQKNDFFKSKQNVAANDYFKKYLSREELNKLFPNKEVTSIQIHYVKHCDYKKGDVISNINGMTMATIEFGDNTIDSIRWKDTSYKPISKGAAKDYFEQYLSRGELNKLFQNKEITSIDIHYVKNRDYKKGDILSNINGMTMMTIEFGDNIKESIRWADPFYKSNIDDSKDNKGINEANRI